MLPRDKNWRLNRHVSVLSLLWHCGGWRLIGTMRSFGTHAVEKQWQCCFAVYTDTVYEISVVFCADSLLKRMVWSCCWSLCNRTIRRWETLHRGCCQSLLLIRQLHWNCANSGMHTACLYYVRISCSSRVMEAWHSFHRESVDGSRKHEVTADVSPG